MKEKPTVCLNDVKFMMVICSGVLHYSAPKADKAGIQIK